MDKRAITIASFILAVLTCGCGNMGSKEDENQDKFYTVTGGWDWLRIPLLKPYELKNASPKTKNSWDIEFVNSFGTFNVKKVDVQDSVIYLLSGRINKSDTNTITIVNSKNVPTAWFAIDVKTKTEKGFASEEEFKAYIKTNNYPVPQWHDIDSLSKALGEGGKVPWMPKQ